MRRPRAGRWPDGGVSKFQIVVVVVRIVVPRVVAIARVLISLDPSPVVHASPRASRVVRVVRPRVFARQPDRSPLCGSFASPKRARASRPSTPRARDLTRARRGRRSPERSRFGASPCSVVAARSASVEGRDILNFLFALGSCVRFSLNLWFVCAFQSHSEVRVCVSVSPFQSHRFGLTVRSIRVGAGRRGTSSRVASRRRRLRRRRRRRRWRRSSAIERRARA